MVSVYPKASRGGGIHRQVSTTSTISRGSFAGAHTASIKRNPKLNKSQRESSLLGQKLMLIFTQLALILLTKDDSLVAKRI